MKKYLEIEYKDRIYLFDSNANIVAGLNQAPLSKKGFQEGKKQYYEIEEGLEPNQVYLESCITGLLKLKDQVSAIFTSPPYNASKPYDDSVSGEYEYDDSMPYVEYLKLMKRFMNSAYISLKEGGVFGLNISNVMAEGEKRPTGIDLLNIAIDVGFTFQEQILWVKPLGAGKQRTGSYILSYKKYQDRLELYETLKEEKEPKKILAELQQKKKELLSKINELKKNNKDYSKIDQLRYDLNNKIRVLELIVNKENVKEKLEQEASQVYRPNPITEYIWILTKGDDIKNKTCIDLKQEKDKLYNVWYDKSTALYNTSSMLGVDVDKENITKILPKVAQEIFAKESENIYKQALNDLGEYLLSKIKPRIKKEEKITTINKIIKEEYKKAIKQIDIAKYAEKYIKQTIKKRENNIKEALSESFAKFYRIFTDNWEIAPTNTKVAKHPAPFPVELPERFIELYLPDGELIVDPFNGSGSTLRAAIRLNRKYNRHYKYIGFDISEEYIELAKDNIRKELNN